jgi:isochorismate synthase
MNATLPRTLTSYLASRADQLLQNGWSFALYREPEQSEAHLIAAPAPIYAEPRMVGAAPGFAIQPFQGLPAVIPGTYRGAFHDGGLLEETGHLPSSASDDLKFGAAPARTHALPYAERVRRAVRALQESVADKVVLSDVVRKLTADSLRPLDVWSRLEREYPTAFVSMVYTADHGLWIGASPELLVAWEECRTVRTMALAGTRAHPGLAGDLGDVAWTQKEIEEHAYVVRDIIETFKQIRLREYVESGPRTVAAGPVVHLCTEFRIDARATDRLGLADDLRVRLHPTSAVCGTPRSAARELIDRLDPHDRELYSGYIGPLGMEAGSRMYVNLRCLRWYDDAVELFVGAGITRASEPEREAKEIQLKAQTLHRVLVGGV